MVRKAQLTPLILLTICSVLLFLPLESNIGQELTTMLKVTLSVYAVLRGLNAVISTAQGTELSIEPMGVGLTLTPGEILDPLNDLIEQVSTVLLFASASIRNTKNTVEPYRYRAVEVGARNVFPLRSSIYYFSESIIKTSKVIASLSCGNDYFKINGAEHGFNV